METLTYARPDSTIRFNRLALGALILTLVPITQLIWRWIATPLFSHFGIGLPLYLQPMPSILVAAILAVGVSITCTIIVPLQSNRRARGATLVLVGLHLMAIVVFYGILILAIRTGYLGSPHYKYISLTAKVVSATSLLFLAATLVIGIFFMLRVAAHSNSRWVGIFGSVVLSLSTAITLILFTFRLIYLVWDIYGTTPYVQFYELLDGITAIASLIHQLAELLLWSTITIWAFRRTSA